MDQTLNDRLITRSVTITIKQHEYLEKKGINFSKWVRNKLEEEIAKYPLEIK